LLFAITGGKPSYRICQQSTHSNNLFSEPLFYHFQGRICTLPHPIDLYSPRLPRLFYVIYSSQRVRGLGKGFEVLSVVFVCLYHQLISQLYMGSNGAKRAASTHKGKSAVVASADLGLVGVDKDSGMSGRAASTVAGHYLVVRPPYRLLVNELNGGIWFWLRGVLASLSDCTNSCSEQRKRTWREKSVCSKRGPVIACERGFWLRAQIPVRLGACWVSMGARPSVTLGAVSAFEVETGVSDSN